MVGLCGLGYLTPRLQAADNATHSVPEAGLKEKFE
jgi:hypothetical protein